jgi:hypothetical protein
MFANGQSFFLIFSLLKNKEAKQKPDIAVHACNPSTQEAEAGGFARSKTAKAAWRLCGVRGSRQGHGRKEGRRGAGEKNIQKLKRTSLKRF